jgi:hypothetical protein
MMSTSLTPADHVALELCPQHVDCGGCHHAADRITRFVDEKLADAYKPIHDLMRGWAKTTDMTAWTPKQGASMAAMSHVLEELRKVVGHEGQA